MFFTGDMCSANRQRYHLPMFSVESVCLCCNYWKPWSRKLIFGMQVHLRNI